MTLVGLPRQVLYTRSGVIDHGVLCLCWSHSRHFQADELPVLWHRFTHDARGDGIVSDPLDPAPLPEGLPIPAADWQQTPLSVRLAVLTLLKRLEMPEARRHQNSSNSSRPPSTDVPLKKRQRRMPAADRRKSGATPGHPGHQQMLLEPTTTVSRFPEACSCGHRGFVDLTLSHTHPGIELPVMHPER